MAGFLDRHGFTPRFVYGMLVIARAAASAARAVARRCCERAERDLQRPLRQRLANLVGGTSCLGSQAQVIRDRAPTRTPRQSIPKADRQPRACARWAWRSS